MHRLLPPNRRYRVRLVLVVPAADVLAQLCRHGRLADVSDRLGHARLSSAARRPVDPVAQSPLHWLCPLGESRQQRDSDVVGGRSVLRRLPRVPDEPDRAGRDPRVQQRLSCESLRIAAFARSWGRLRCRLQLCRPETTRRHRERRRRGGRVLRRPLLRLPHRRGTKLESGPVRRDRRRAASWRQVLRRRVRFARRDRVVAAVAADRRSAAGRRPWLLRLWVAPWRSAGTGMRGTSSSAAVRSFRWERVRTGSS